jgi:NTP pyrophosphatase (non-canonical NTP hydrolase)
LNNKERKEKILHYILQERQNQDDKWGIQHHSFDRWLSILGEEYGKVCKAVNENKPDEYREELIQVAAVCIAMIEDFHVDNCCFRNFYKTDNYDIKVSIDG